MALPGYSNSSIIPPSPGEGSAWEVGVGFTPGVGSMRGAEGIVAAQEFLNRIAQQYGYGSEFDPDLYGGLGQPGGPEMQEQDTPDARPVTIVQRNEAGEEIGRVPGVRIGYGDTARIVTAEELIRINEERRRSGQELISVSTPPFAPEIVDESGAAITNETGSTDANADANNSNDDNMRTNNTTSGSIYGQALPGEGGGGGGVLQIELGGQIIEIPEGKTALQHVGDLFTQGLLTRELYDEFINRPSRTSTGLPTAGEVVTDPNLLPGGVGSDSTVIDTTGTGQVTDTTGTGDVTGSTDATGTGDVTTGNLTTGDVTTSLQGGDVTTSLQGGDTTVSTGDTSFTGGDLYGGDVTTGDTSLTTGDTLLTTGATTLTGGDVTTGPVTTDVTSTGGAGGAGGAGGNVNITFAGGSGGDAAYQSFFDMINSYIEKGEPIEEGDVAGIYQRFIETSPEAAASIRSFLQLDRPVSEEQARLKTDIYGNLIGEIREAQSPLMQSLAQRSEQLGAQAESLMGPLSFLESRGATQAGYGQAAALGRAIDPGLREQQAGRLREEQRNINLQLAGNLLGQQRATAGLMADIESGIYGQMAPDIGLDFGQMLGISGVDVQNVLGERQSARAARAAERGANIKLGIEAAPTVFSAAKTGWDWLTGRGN